ncbi:MAG: adenine phosphoribosyltransferase [Steroidobacteraceae bacterium]
MYTRSMLIDHIRTIPDYPKPGIQFRDITTLLADPTAYRETIDQLAAPFLDVGIDRVIGIEARGFILGGALADRLHAGFVPVRKKGKLPHETLRVAYALEYGTDEIEIHRDALAHGERVLLVDDLIATGGTALAAVQLVETLGATIIAAAFVIDLPELGGSQKLRSRGVDIHTLLSFAGH